MGHHLAEFLAPEGYTQPRFCALARELAFGAEVGRASWDVLASCRARRAVPWTARVAAAPAEPVLLVPGFLAGDYTLRALGRQLRAEGYRTYRSRIRTNVSCLFTNAALLERRLEEISARRGTRVRIVGHSLGGILARGLAVRRPDLVAGIVTLGSPMMAPGTAHPVLLTAADVLVRLSRAGVPGLMSEDCVAGSCARQAWEESRMPLPADVGFTTLYSRADGLVDWRSCIDPLARAVEVRASHLGLAIDPVVARTVVAELRLQRDRRPAVDDQRSKSIAE